MSTPHNSAELGDIAQTVLMPGDPLRAKFIAETFLSDVKQYNSVRSMLGFTGLYKGKRVSVQGSGMGVPSMGIYSYELFNFYDVRNIIRIGTAGALDADLHIGDIVLAQAACYDTTYVNQYRLPGVYSPCGDFELIETAVSILREGGTKTVVGNVMTSDAFYGETKDDMRAWANMGVKAVEMETAALYMNAAQAKRRALAILTISDGIFSGESASAAERQSNFTKMMETALDISARIVTEK